MPTTFLLDPRVLDDSVDDGEKDVEIPAKAFAHFLLGENSQPSYTFYLPSVTKSASLSMLSLGIFSAPYDGHHGDLSLRFQKANLIFMPVSDGDRYQWGSSVRYFRERYILSCEVLYVRGDFKKGDAETLKNYGVTIKTQ
ncbi:MAG TPA: hypothetical protein VJA18_02455 [Candidatus Nanoarchaeia archaeon]|nr:hypothetical protein [Candidatus Nanoarchaeia archaeon]